MQKVRMVMVAGITMALIALTLGVLMHKGTQYINKSPPLIGDIDNSGRVDGFDLGRFGVAHGTREGDPLWDPKLDLNDDGVLDGKDLIILQEHFGDVENK